jgi:hypothetical protein
MDVVTLAAANAAARRGFIPQRAALRMDPTSKANGAISSRADTGQALTTFVSPTAPAPLSINGGLIVHTPYSGANSAGYLQANLGGLVRRFGCTASWPTNALGVLAMVLPSGPWSTGVLPDAGFHLSINGNGIWTLIHFSTGGSTTIASNATHGRWSTVWGLGLQTFDVWIDPDNNKAVIVWPDGSSTTIISAYFGSAGTSNYAVWELFENNGATDVAASIGEVWADTAPVTPDVPALTPFRAVKLNSPAAYNVSGTFNPNFDLTTIHEVTLVGNITAMTPSGSPAHGQVLQIELIQDATGSRTLAGVSSTVKWAGGVAPTLTTTPARRDIFRFRSTGSTWLEISRSMNVG